jgi:hypothetical protein
VVIKVAIDKQRQINEIPQGGIVDTKNIPYLGFYQGTESYMSKEQFKKFQKLADTISNISVPTINSFGSISINFDYTPDMQEEIVKKIIKELEKKV